MNTQLSELVYNDCALTLSLVIFVTANVWLTTWMLNQVFTDTGFVRAINKFKKWVYVTLFGIGGIAALGLVLATIYFELNK